MKKSMGLFIFSFFILSALSAQQIEYLTPKLIDHGRIKQGTTVLDTIRFVNIGKKPIQIEDIRSGCGCTVTKTENYDVTPGDTAEISYVLKTDNFKTLIRKSLHVIFKNQNPKEILYTIQADVYTVLDVEPRYVYFYHIVANPDTLIPRHIRIQNHSEQPLDLTFQIPETNLLEIFPHHTTVQPGEEITLTVVLKPLHATDQRFYVIVETSCEEKPVFHIPVFIGIKT